MEDEYYDPDRDENPSPSNEQHTSFLDLTTTTNGREIGEHHHYDSEEGDGGGSEQQQHHQAEGHDLYHHHGMEEYEDEEEDELADDGGYHRNAVASSSSGRAQQVNPNTPGKVVEAGQEQTGRWTREEHEAFLDALKVYGKEWKKVAAKVKTRTVVQTRTHAQKYFQKLQKVQDEVSGDVDHVDMGISASERKPSSQKKKKPIPIKPGRRSSSTTLSAAQVMANFSQQATISAGFAAAPTAAVVPAHDMAYDSGEPPRHGFSSHDWQKKDMKILAPDPMAAAAAGKFPEPSPAATGKRKLAEIAAARMLAGVAGSAIPLREDAPTPPPPSSTSMDDRATPPPSYFGGPPPPPLLVGTAEPPAGRKGLSLQIVNPDTLGVSNEKRRRTGDSPVTPWDGQMEALLSEKPKTSPASTPGAATETGAPLLPKSGRQGGEHPVCGPGTQYDRSLLHQAICEMDIESLQTQLSNSSYLMAEMDEAGFAPLHTACALRLKHPDHSVAAVELTKLLIQSGADVSVVDRNGNTALHWAARAGDREVVEILLRKSCPLEGRNKDGETPLHWGMRAGNFALEAVALLLDSGARANALNNKCRRPVDLAADGFMDEEHSIAFLRARDARDHHKKFSKELKSALKHKNAEMRECRKNLLERSVHSRTLVLHHPECLEHVPKSSSDWEAPDRVITILEHLASSMEEGCARPAVHAHEVTLSTEFERAKLDLLKRVHGAEYLSFVHDLSKDLERKIKGSHDDESDKPAPVVPFTPMVQRTMIKINEEHVKLGVNSDTAFSAGSLRAARRAAGAVQHAVDCVLVGRNRNAFCVVRPPGHHAGVNGLLDGGESCGFCIFNNVAAGALYAITNERDLCGRCAIVDIDVHHGNGTEEIIRKFSDPSRLFFFSIHLYDNDNRKRAPNQFQYKFYPGTGSEDDLALNILNVPIQPLWRDQNPPATPALRTHNTRHKAKGAPKSTSDTQDDSSVGTPRGSAKNSDVEAGSMSAGSTTPQPGSGGSSGRVAYRQAIQNRLLPALRAFNPDLILISAGFDAARGDVGNARHERGGRERMGLDLESEDYAWTTRKILEIADICCHGRVVSVLEGGYGRSAPPSVDTPNEAGLDRSVLAECAVRHLHAFIDPYDIEHRFSHTSRVGNK
uniref:histone deacetylase n=1 Tax=Amphora coffeiformis TaxID=265554 RepID=A0A6S8HTR1_9STRA